MRPKERTYFNVEITHSKRTLVFNASKQGIDAFLHTHGRELPPKEIDLKPTSRLQRCWESRKLSENPEPLPTDPTCYMSQFAEGGINLLAHTLQFKLIEQNQQERIFYAYLDNETPVIVVNAEGWRLFLRILMTLRDKRDWFYVTRPNGQTWEHLPFQLSEPPINKNVFLAIECIRLEPEQEIKLRASFDLENPKSNVPNYFCLQQYIGGNSTGLLLFSDWMEDFAECSSPTKDIQHPSKNSWIRLRRVGKDSKEPLISFESMQDGSSDIYIYGNQTGFRELAYITEIYAFSTDHDCFLEKPPGQRFKGDTTEGILGPKGSRSLNSWEVVGGCIFSDKYNPELRDWDGIKNFVNQRIIKNDNN
ncbi:MAG: hypothetical protein WAM28_03575 [Chlamydiales bacterium]